jgi:hypothetical protein
MKCCKQSIPLFQIDNEEDGEDIINSDATEENPDDHVVPNTNSNKRKLAKQRDATIEIESSLNTSGQDTTPVTQKRRKVNARTEFLIPYEDYANVNSFISFYVEKHQITSTIRWNESSLANLHLALSEWSNPIMDTDKEVQKNINFYLKCKNQANSSATLTSPPLAPVPPEISTANLVN